MSALAVAADPTSEPALPERETQTVVQRLSRQTLGRIVRVEAFQKLASDEDREHKAEGVVPTTAPARDEGIIAFSGMKPIGQSADRDFNAPLTALLWDPKTFEDSTYGFLDDDQLGLRLYTTADEVDVVIDLDLNLLRIVGTGPGTLEHSQPVSVRPGRAALVRLLKNAFPANATMQALTDRAQRVRRRLGEKIVDLVEKPQQVDCLRMAGWYQGHYRRSTPRPTTAPLEVIDDYAVFARSTLASERLSNDLAAALLDDDTFPPLSPAMCFDPGFGVRFTSGARSVTYLICFECRRCLVIYRDREAPFGARENSVWGGSMGREGWHRLADLAKRAFLNDPAIQSLGAAKSATAPTTRPTP